MASRLRQIEQKATKGRGLPKKRLDVVLCFLGYLLFKFFSSDNSQKETKETKIREREPEPPVVAAAKVLPLPARRAGSETEWTDLPLSRGELHRVWFPRLFVSS
jgi:hypothetical protein